MPALHFFEHGRLNQLCSANEGRELLTLRLKTLRLFIHAKVAKPRCRSGRRRRTRRDFRCENVGMCEGGFELGNIGSGGISEAA